MAILDKRGEIFMKNKTFSSQRNLTEMKQNGLERAGEQMGVVRPLTTQTMKILFKTNLETRGCCSIRFKEFNTHSLIVDLKQ